MSNARQLSKVFRLAPIVGWLLSAFNNKSTIPTGAMMEWSARDTPDGWIFADGLPLTAEMQHALALRELYINQGYPHGRDANNNPLLPDTRGRVTASPDWTGTRLPNTAQIGAVVGSATHLLTAAQSGMPAHAHTVNDPTHAHSIADPGHAHGVYDPGHAHGGAFLSNTYGGQSVAPNTDWGWTHTGIPAAGTGIGIYGAGTGIGIYGSGTGVTINASGAPDAVQAHPIVQPTLIVPKMVKL